VVEDPHGALAPILDLLHPRVPEEPEIHPSAVLGRGVRVGAKVRIAPYAVIEEDVEIGDGSVVGAHVVVGAGARVGTECHLHPHAVVYPGVVLGDRVILHAGARIGADGFGYAATEGGVQKVPQVGTCVIEADVEIGANSTVDRGSIGETRVMAGAKLDNLVHLGHNVVVGRSALLAAQVGVAGSSRVGAGVLAGGQAGIAGHLSVGDGAQLAAQTGVIGDIEPGETVMGFPARPRAEYLRTAAAQSRLPRLLSKVRELEERLSRMEGARGGESDSPHS
jgi:UDP-3-O-[3-hydroxymyristoyl] glucosamine N-acyltransferase